MSTSLYECCICHRHARKSLSGILRHIREVHPHFEGPVPCGIDGCPSTPTSYEGLRQHMYRYHKHHLVLSRPDSAAAESSAGDGSILTSAEQPLNDPDESNIMDDCESTQTIEEPTSQTKLLGAQFILKTRDGKKLTQVSTNGIINDTKIILQSTLEAIEKKVLGMEPALTDAQIATVKDIFSDVTLVDPFIGLETEYKQEMFIRDHFNYVVCQQ